MENINPGDLTKKLLDNIVWVIINCSIHLIISFISTSSFNVNRRIENLNKTYKGKLNLKGIEFHSKSGDEELFDEIDLDKHLLTDVRISSSCKSYLSGRQMLDNSSEGMVIQTLKMGAKYFELDLFLSLEVKL